MIYQNFYSSVNFEGSMARSNSVYLYRPQVYDKFKPTRNIQEITNCQSKLLTIQEENSPDLVITLISSSQEHLLEFCKSKLLQT